MSTASDPVCRNCRVSMEKGVVHDFGHGGRKDLPKWTQGEPIERRFLGIPMGFESKDRKSMTVMAWRCPRCGLLESYAR
jgi:hypothetical protein